MKVKNIKKFFLNDISRFNALNLRGFYNYLSDEKFLKKAYRIKMKKELDLNNPKSFNEKVQWLKIYDRKPEYTMMVDKYEVKKYVADKIGEEYIIPTLGVWENFEEIDFHKLPDKFVLKCTHDSGGIVICNDKQKFDKKYAEKKINKCMKYNFFWLGREWPYKNIKPRIIAEQYLEDKQGNELTDYKFFTFDGVVKLLFIATDRQNKEEETKFDFFDVDFNHLDIINGHPNAKIVPKKPKCFDKMKYLAEKLSKGIPHLRVDFYEVNGRVYFGELTFSHWSGMVPFEPQKWDTILGSYIKLPEVKS